MGFPKHNILRDNDNPIFEYMEKKQIGFSPLVFCEFFQGMEVLQLFGQETKQYIYGLYFNGHLVGTVYFGDLYNDKQILRIKEEFFPLRWEDINNYVQSKSGVWYCKMHTSQYAFVLENPNVLEKIK